MIPVNSQSNYMRDIHLYFLRSFHYLFFSYLFPNWFTKSNRIIFFSFWFFSPLHIFSLTAYISFVLNKHKYSYNTQRHIRANTIHSFLSSDSFMSRFLQFSVFFLFFFCKKDAKSEYFHDICHTKFHQNIQMKIIIGRNTNGCVNEK